MLLVVDAKPYSAEQVIQGYRLGCEKLRRLVCKERVRSQSDSGILFAMTL